MWVGGGGDGKAGEGKRGEQSCEGSDQEGRTMRWWAGREDDSKERDKGD